MALVWESPSRRFTLWDDKPHTAVGWEHCSAASEARDDPERVGANPRTEANCATRDFLGPDVDDVKIYKLYNYLMSNFKTDEDREAWLAAMIAMGGLDDASSDACPCNVPA